MIEKLCSLCEQLLPGPAFRIRRRRGYRDSLSSACIACTNKQQRSYRASGKVYKYPKKDKELHLLRTYNISTERFNELLASQNGTCAICEQVAGRWHVDHDHATNEVRGILCHHCNVMLGFSRDSSDVLRSGADYLDTFNASRRSPGSFKHSAA
jgi:Recombination endonuclease VII